MHQVFHAVISVFSYFFNTRLLRSPVFSGINLNQFYARALLQSEVAIFFYKTAKPVFCAWFGLVGRSHSYKGNIQTEHFINICIYKQ